MESSSHTSKQNNNIWMIIAILLFVVCIGEGYFVIKERNEKMALGMHYATSQSGMMKPSVGTPGKRPAPMMVMKGQTFADSALFSKAYLIYPVTGQLSGDAQKALTGWDMKTTQNTDGSTQVDLIPKEAEDIKQSFTVKTGYKLYFIEMNLIDDQTGIDKNRGDDIGVLVDPSGTVQ